MSDIFPTTVLGFRKYFHSVPIAGIRYPFPGRELTLPELLGVCDQIGGFTTDSDLPKEGLARELETRLKACEHASGVSSTPIVGVCGTMNSGKSTVVASLLSIEERKRVLIGQRGEEGTHRFVFWVPAAWKEDGRNQALQALIKQTTGGRLELLKEDPEGAAVQYNARRDRMEEFNIPLLAFDPGLDKAGIAFLDCPDIQRSLAVSSGEETAPMRLDRLRAMAPMCSAFFVVVSMQQLEGEQTKKVFECIRGTSRKAPVYVLLNMTPFDNPESYHREVFETVTNWGMEDLVRGTYFSPQLKPEAPGIPIHPEFRNQEGDTLLKLSTRLEPGELQKRHLDNTVENLRDFLKQVSHQIGRRGDRQKEIILRLRNKVIEFLNNKVFGEEDAIRIMDFNKAAGQINICIRDNAPKHIKVTQNATEYIGILGQKLKGLASRLTPLAAKVSPIKTREATDADIEGYAQIKSGDFAMAMMEHTCLPADTSKETLVKIWQVALKNIEDTAKQLDPQELKDRVKALWTEVPFTRQLQLYRNIGLSVLVFSVVGALAPFDTGASFVIMTKYHIILGGSEILAIAVGGPLAGILASLEPTKQLIRQMENKLAWPQVSQIYANLMDGLGVPRYLHGAPSLTSPNGTSTPISEVKSESRGALVEPLQGPLLEINEKALGGLLDGLQSTKA